MKNLTRLILFTILIFTAINVYANDKPSVAFNITGIKGDALKNAENRLKIAVNSADKLTPSLAKTIYIEGPETIKKALEPFGYFKTSITRSGFKQNDKQWIASYHISPGKPLRVTQLILKIIGPGKNNPAIVSTLKSTQLKAGNVFNANQLSDTKKALLNTAHRQGYIKASFVTSRTLINLNTYTSKIDLVMDTKNRYYFGHTSFKKNPLSEKFLRHYLTFKSGDVFSSRKLLQFENALNGAGYYKAVNVVPEVRKVSNRRVPIHVDLNPFEKQLYEIGLGYGTVSGPRIQGGIHWRWVNPGGDKFSTSFRISKVDRFLEANYTIPGERPANDHYSINAGVYNLTPGNNDDNEAFVYKVGGAYHTLSGNWQLSYGLNYQIERFRIEDDPFQTAKMLRPSLSVTWQDVRNVIQVNNGSRVTFTVNGAYDGALSSVSFVQTRLDFKTLHTFFKNYRVLFRTDIGATETSDIDTLPLTARFFTGGPDSVRGYSIQGLGPGRYLTVASLELQRRIYKQFYAAVFYDVGNAFNRFNDYSDDLRRSRGVGVVWLSPVGSVSLYAAQAVSLSDKPIRFEFDLGAAL